MRSTENAVMARFANCIQCIFCALERLLKCLLRNAYIIVALEGTAMTTSGKRAATLMEKYLSDIYAVNVVGDYIMFLVKILLAALIGVLCYWMIPVSCYFEVPYKFIKYKIDIILYEQDKDVYGKLAIIPAIFGLMISYLIIHCFMSVFEMTVDTILICYCVDLDWNNGSYEKPFYMSAEMMQTMEEVRGFVQHPTTTRYFQGSQYQSI